MLFCLFQKYLDYGFVDRKQGVSVRIVERPGLCLSEEERGKLVADLRAVVRESVPSGSLDYGVLTGDANALSRAVITLISDLTTGRPLAFNALAYMPCRLRGAPVDVLHLGLVVVSPGCREGGFSWVLYGFTSILLFMRARFRPIWVSNVTQVPAIIGKVTESFRDVYPSPRSEGKPSIEHLMLVKQIMRSHRHVFGVSEDAGFNEDSFVITNAYTGGSDHLKKTFEQAQPHRREVYNTFCRSSLDYQRGDDFIQIGKLDLEAVKGYLTKSVPKESLLVVATGIAVAALQGLVLPFWHWFQCRSHYGAIRPWN